MIFFGSFAAMYIKSAEKIDWMSEIRKKGEKSVPAVRFAATDLKTARKKNDFSGKLSAQSTVALESPNLKNGKTRGNADSAQA